MKKKIINSPFFFLDFIFIVLFYYFVEEIRSSFSVFGASSFSGHPLGSTFLFFTIIMFTFLYEEIYIQRFDFWEETRLIVKSLFLSFVIILSILMLEKVNQNYSRSLFIMYFLGLMVCLPIYKRIIKNFVFKIKFFRKKVKLVGNQEQIERLSNEFKENWYLGFDIVKNKPDAIFIASKDLDKKTIETYFRRYSKKVRDIYILPVMENINFSQSQIVEYFNIRASVIKIDNNLLKKENILLKDLFEKTLVICILPFFLLLHALISFLIKQDNKSVNILFKQKRLGKDNTTFKCYKYTTMLENSNALLEEYLQKNPDEIEHYNTFHKYKNDPRITKIGRILRKTSLDEIPQLINVLKGEMSLIGPRPYLPSESSKLKNDIDVILRVKPGISGLWQVSGRSELSFIDRKNLDVWYIQNWSLWMDIVILIKTLKVVLAKTGAK